MKRILSSVLMMLALVSSSFAQETTTMTMTGTVVSATYDALVIDTPTGRITFGLDSALDRVAYGGVKPGAQVAVTHVVDAQGMNRVAKEIVVTAAAPSDRSTSDDRYAADDRLPDTASPIAAVALFGIAALLGGWLLRNRKSADKPSTPRRPGP